MFRTLYLPEHFPAYYEIQTPMPTTLAAQLLSPIESPAVGGRAKAIRVRCIGQSGNNRQVIFAAAAYYQFFRYVLIEAAQKHSFAIHASVCMTNHVHSTSPRP